MCFLSRHFAFDAVHLQTLWNIHQITPMVTGISEKEWKLSYGLTSPQLIMVICGNTRGLISWGKKPYLHFQRLSCKFISKVSKGSFANSTHVCSNQETRLMFLSKRFPNVSFLDRLCRNKSEKEWCFEFVCNFVVFHDLLHTEVKE